MSYDLSVKQKRGYLHLTVTGENTPESVAGYLSEVPAQCVEHRCSYVLIEENLRGPSLKIPAIFDIAAEGSRHVWPEVRAIAYVDINSEHDPSRMQFAEDVAVNRGAFVRVFSSVMEAEEWLVKQIPQERCDQITP